MMHLYFGIFLVSAIHCIAKDDVSSGFVGLVFLMFTLFKFYKVDSKVDDLAIKNHELKIKKLELEIEILKKLDETN